MGASAVRKNFKDLLDIRGRGLQAVDIETVDGAQDKADAAVSSVGVIPVAPITGSPETEIQTALDIAAAHVAAGTGLPNRVKVAPGEYTVDIHLLPNQGSSTDKRAAACWFDDGVEIDLTGVTLKLKAGVTLPAGANAGHILCSTTPTIRPAEGGAIKRNNRIIGGVLDGNAANQTYGAGSSADGDNPLVRAGLYLGFCRGGKVIGTKAQNVWGNAPGHPGEGFHFVDTYCLNTEYVGCEVDGGADGSGMTASGFGSDRSHGTSYVDCNSHDLGYGHGFASWECSSLTRTNCHAWSNGKSGAAGGSGINDELGVDIVNGSTVAGGRMLKTFGTDSDTWYVANDTALGNATGWLVQGCTRYIVGADCSSSYNAGNGVRVVREAAVSPAVPSSDVLVGGIHLHNGATYADNVHIESAADGGSNIDQGQVNVVARIRDDVGVLGVSHYGVAPTVVYQDKAQSGMRVYLDTADSFRANPAAWLVRWLDILDGTSPRLAITEVGQVFSAGRRFTRAAKSGDYTLTATDHYIGCTGTATTAQTITMPATADVGAGATYIIADEAGGASTHPITILPKAAATFDGAASLTIGVNYGYAVLVCVGSTWKVLARKIAGKQLAGIMAPEGLRPNNSLTPSGSSRYLMRIVPEEDFTFTKIRLGVSVAATNNDACDVGVLDSTGTPIVSAGATTGKMNAGGNTVAEFTVASTTLKAGKVYYGCFTYGTVGGTAATISALNFGSAVFGGLLETTAGTLDGNCPNLKITSGTPHPIGSTVTAPTSCFLTSAVPAMALMP